MQFADRVQAGKDLAAALAEYTDREDVLLFALPRGGVPVAAEVADALHLPLDVILVRKLGVPGQRELAMGAISIGGFCVLNDNIISQLQLGQSDIDKVLTVEREELERRNRTYRNNRPMPELGDKTVIVIDDGLATGATMRAAVSAVKARHPREIIVAVPVGAVETCSELEAHVGKVVCLYKPVPFQGVGRWYINFAQVSDDEVEALLDRYGVHPGNSGNISGNTRGESHHKVDRHG